jgi:uncharacterized protein YdhG (YjbR/CyaY superfamily)
MPSNNTTPEAFISALPEDRKKVINEIRNVILKNLPKGFEEVIGYGMLAYVVPHKLYPNGYHVDPKLPLPFINLASQKNFIALYHMGIYADKELLKWFTTEYAKVSQTKLDMGKSCIRFKKIDQIPIDLIGKLVNKVSTKDWIQLYESGLTKRKK